MLFALLFCVVFNTSGSLTAASTVQGGNTIEGWVKTAGLKPISDLRVILQDKTYSQIGSVFTDSSGRFRFSSLPSGIYYVEADPGVHNYERQTMRVDATTRGGRNSTYRVDIFLKLKEPDKVKLVAPVSKSIVFYQPVPDEAKKAYASAVKSLEKSDYQAATVSLNRAIQIFPDYYDALELLGTEYLKGQQYEPAIQYLARAVKVNRDGWRAFYALGVAQYETKQWGDAVKSFQRAVELNPDSANANMMLGMAFATDDNSRAQAIQSLEKAISMGKEKIPQALFYVGILYGKNNQHREAADSLEEYLRLSPVAGERDKIKQLIKDLREKAKTQNRK